MARSSSLSALTPISRDRYKRITGLTIFRGLYELVAVGGGAAGSLSLQSGVTTLFGAFAVLLAIATGTVLGELLASPWDRQIRGSAPGGNRGGSARGGGTARS